LEGDIWMENSTMSEREKKVFQTGLFDNLTVQDAVTIIALYAANLELEEGKEDLEATILEVLSKDKLFREDPSHITSRINKFSISMEEVNPLNAVIRAAEVLTPELQQKAFLLAVQIAKTTQKIRTMKILKSLGSKLTIENKFFESVNDDMDQP
jgi:hypothetical protein